MTRNSDTNKSMAFFYPVIVYFVVVAVLNQAGSLFQTDAVVKQAWISFAAGAVIYFAFIRTDRKTRGSDATQNILQSVRQPDIWVGIVLAMIGLGCAGIAMNNVIAWSGLARISDTYQQVEQTFYSSDLWRELIALGIVTPLAEEILYREAVFYRLRDSYGKNTAILGSALIFGVLHMNLVQGVYGFVLGLMLALLMEKYRSICVPFAGHAAANVIAVLRAETGFLSYMKSGELWFVPMTVLLAAVALLAAGYCVRSCKNNI